VSIRLDLLGSMGTPSLKLFFSGIMVVVNFQML
jgi:hypothetical protein